MAIPESIPISTPGPNGSGFLQVSIDSKAMHMGQMQMKSNPVADRSEPEPSGSGLLFFDSEPTHVGRRRRCRDMSGLSLCLCRDIVPPDSVGSIKCQKVGCETTWVRIFVDFARPKLKQCSIIFSVLRLRMQDYDNGPVRHAH